MDLLVHGGGCHVDVLLPQVKEEEDQEELAVSIYGYLVDSRLPPIMNIAE